MEGKSGRFEQIELAVDPHPPAPPPEPVKRRLGLFLAAALGLVALLDVARVLAGAYGAPGEADWRAAEQTVRKAFHPGDLIVAAPGWADPDMRLYLGDLVPVAVAARADADRYAHVIEVTVRGARAPETAAAQCISLLDGPVRVRRCDKPAVPAVDVRYDFVAELAQAEVALVRDGREVPCPREGDHFSCPGVAVRAIIGEVDYAPHRCIVATPALPDEGVRIRWPAVPLGTRLVGYTGIHSFYARKAARGAVDVDIAIGARASAHLVHKNDDGWRRFEIATDEDKGTTRSVRFELRAQAPTERRLCFTAESRS